jgi:cytochrome c551/c552
LVAQGKEIFDSVGCRACHAIAPDEVATPLGASKDWAPNLQRVGEKTSARFLYWWVLNPHGYNPGTRMPSLRLSDEEARALVSYLLSLSEKPAPTEGAVTAADLEQPALAEQGKALVRKYGCFACHEINGMEGESRIGVELSTFGAKGLEELFFGNRGEIPRTWNDWTFGKLKSRAYATEHVEQLMPLPARRRTPRAPGLAAEPHRAEPPRQFRDPRTTPEDRQGAGDREQPPGCLRSTIGWLSPPALRDNRPARRRS